MVTNDTNVSRKKNYISEDSPKDLSMFMRIFFIKVSKRAAYICEKSFFYKCPKEQPLIV